jgi:L-lactate dehydrogenase
MKIGIVGSGMVGSTTAYVVLMRGLGGEIVLVDRNTARSDAEAQDILHAVPFTTPIQVRAGDYEDLSARHRTVSGAFERAPAD